MVELTVVVLTSIAFCIYKEYVTNKQITDLTTKLMARNIYEYQAVAHPESVPEVEKIPEFMSLDEVPEDELRDIFNKKD
jgi:Tfp pilus assembly major pilin PilA